MQNPTTNQTASSKLQTVTPDISVLKERLRATWMAGNYDYFSRLMSSSADEFLDRIDVPRGATFLDVACGSGQLALIAASRGAKVTGVDIASNSIQAARDRAEADDLAVQFDVGDAEDLPYADGQFDVVATIYGAMFAPRPELVAREFVRVCRPGGTLAMANWTKEGFVGQMLGVVSAFVSPPGMPSPLLWGNPDVVRERFGDSVENLRLDRVNYRFDYPFSPSGVVDFFRDNYGPTTRAFASLPDADQKRLHAELTALFSRHNTSKEQSRTVVSSEYLNVIATRA